MDGYMKTGAIKIFQASKKVFCKIVKMGLLIVLNVWYNHHIKTNAPVIPAR